MHEAPKVFYRNNWGRYANTAELYSTSETFACVAIAPDSEADSVELRIDGTQGIAQQIIVSRNAPYFGPVPGRGTRVYPTIQVPPSDATHDHRVKLLLYTCPPPFIPTRRAPARYDLCVGDGANAAELLAVDTAFPFIPVMGRDTVYVAGSIYTDGTGDVDLVVKGGRAAGHMVGAGDPSELVKNRFGAGYETHKWGIAGNLGLYENVQWTTLNTEAAIANANAAAEFSYQYAGDFDFIAVEVTRNAGNYAAQLRLVAKDS